MSRHIGLDAIKLVLAPRDEGDVLDGVKPGPEKAPEKQPVPAKEPAKKKDDDDDDEMLDSAGEYQANDLALKAAAAVQEWAETPLSELDEGEGSGDRLFSLLAGIVDQDMDGELSDDESELLNTAASIAAEYVVSKGVTEEDAVALLTDFDNELAETVQGLVVESLPDGEDAADADIDAFVFGDGSDDAVLDSAGKSEAVLIRSGRVIGVVNTNLKNGTTVSYGWSKTADGTLVEVGKAKVSRDKKLLKPEATYDLETPYINLGSGPVLDSVVTQDVLDAVYKKKIVVRAGKKIRINKRVSGKVRLSAKQKMAVRKMLRKSHSAKAQVRRAKSMKIRKRSGL